jgi:hypothetical protein
MGEDKVAHLNEVAHRVLKEFHSAFGIDGRKAQKKFLKEFDDQIFGHAKWSTLLKTLTTSEPKSATLLPDAEQLERVAALSVSDKLALVAAARVSSTDNLFEYALTKTHCRNPITDHTLRRYDDYYRYWRYYPSSSPRGAPVLRWGLLSIETHADNYTSLKHWSYDVLQALDQKYNGDMEKIIKNLSPYEDDGIVVFSDLKMFMIGFRKNNVRLSIADLPKDIGLLQTLPVRGMVVTNKDSKDLYAAGFIMYKKSNATCFNKKINKTIFDKRTETFNKNADRLILYSS